MTKPPLAMSAQEARDLVAALTAENAALAAKVNCPRHAAQVIIDEVLQKPCHGAKKLRFAMICATMKARVGGVTSSQRWGMVNAAIRDLARTGDT